MMTVFFINLNLSTTSCYKYSYKLYFVYKINQDKYRTLAINKIQTQSD